MKGAADSFIRESGILLIQQKFGENVDQYQMLNEKHALYFRLSFYYIKSIGTSKIQKIKAVTFDLYTSYNSFDSFDKN